METSALTVKGQLLIPKRIRNKYGMDSGVKVVFEETEDGVIIRPMNDRYFESFRGILKSTGKLKEEMKQFRADEERREEKKLGTLSKAKKQNK